MEQNPLRDRKRQAEWRARMPDLQEIVERLAPRVFSDAVATRVDRVPDAWKRLVAQMREEVVKPPEEWQRDWEPDGLRGYRWSSQVSRVGDMLDYLMRTIRADLDFKEGKETMAQMLLVDLAMVELDIALQNGGGREGRSDIDEHTWRVFQALRPLTPRLDGDYMKRFRALHVADFATKITHVVDENGIEESVRKLRELTDLDAEREQKHRDFVRVDRPVLNGLSVRQFLSEIDNRFGTLDPLVVMQEFAEAEPDGGGKTEDGEGLIGPVRALARLAVMCGALGYSQHEGETFDEAVERARGNLLVTRSRIRKALRDFPGQVRDEDDPDTEVT